MSRGDGPQPDRTVREQLLALIDQAQADHKEFVAATGEEERTATGEPDAWTAKDHLAHLNAWRAVALERLSAAEGGTPPPDRSNVQAFNDQTFARERNTPWDTLVARAQEQFSAARAQIARFSGGDEAWTDLDRYPWREGKSLVTAMTGDFYEHPMEHYIQLALSHGETAEAYALQQASVRQMRELFGGGEAYANALYNLACFYVRQGEGERALDPLREALMQHSPLVEWSKQDRDLDPLRNLPAFQEVYAPGSEASPAGAEATTEASADEETADERA